MKASGDVLATLPFGVDAHLWIVLHCGRVCCCSQDVGSASQRRQRGGRASGIGISGKHIESGQALIVTDRFKESYPSVMLVPTSGSALVPRLKRQKNA
jgi:hypothetical protein